LTVQLVAVAPEAEHVAPPGLDVTVYPVMAEPPEEDGSVQVTVTWGAEPLGRPVTTVAVPIVGALGTVAGVTLLDSAEAVLLPAALLALTEKL
jgi:hypothetical protein